MLDNKAINVHFAHANGFPAGSYRELFSALPNHFSVLALKQFGHNPDFPVNENLSNLVEELLDYLHAHCTEPVYAVGHSMGALLSYMAACEQPEKFKGVIMLDPPIASGRARWLFKFAKYTPLIDKVSPAGMAARRCQSWGLETNLEAYFTSKALFKRFLPVCIRDYVASAIIEKDGRQVLSFNPEVEAQIFRNVPHNINQFYAKLKVPSCLVTAQNSQVCTPAFLKHFIKKTNIEHIVVPDLGHMFPLEHPHMVAKLITNKIAEWEGQQ